MLSRDVSILELGADNWYRFLNLWMDMLRQSGREKGRGPLLVFYRGLKVLKAIDLGAMRPVQIDFHGTSRLAMLSRETGYRRVIALEENAIMRIVGFAQRRLSHQEDYFLQWHHFLEGFAREWGRSIFTFPPGPARLPLVPHELVDLLVKLMVPEDSIVLLVILDEGSVWASAAVGYREGDFWLLTSLEAVFPREELTVGSLDLSSELLASRFGGIVRTISIERKALIDILTGRFPFGSLLWALNSRNLRTRKVPLRWKVAAVLALLVASGTDSDGNI